ncbi:MAG: hypothetical protein HY075_05100 [Deltaproteobacteria bacterium]|nr:hypothetical protein [Deltaproteobacteria bacterium]
MEKQPGEKDKEAQKPESEQNVAHTPDGELPDPEATRVGKEVLTEDDAKKAS